MHEFSIILPPAKPTHNIHSSAGSTPADLHHTHTPHTYTSPPSTNNPADLPMSFSALNPMFVPALSPLSPPHCQVRENHSKQQKRDRERKKTFLCLGNLRSGGCREESWLAKSLAKSWLGTRRPSRTNPFHPDIHNSEFISPVERKDEEE